MPRPAVDQTHRRKVSLFSRNINPPLFNSHRCWQFRPELRVLFPERQLQLDLEDYLHIFLLSVRDAPRIPMMSISSVAYCRTRGAGDYPFLIVHLKDPLFNDFPVRMKLEGFDGPVAAGLNQVGPRDDKMSILSIAPIWESMRKLVGTKHYDVLHTTTFRWDVNEAGEVEPSIVDLLVLAELSTKWDSSREGYPAALSLALNTLFNANVRLVTSSGCSKAPPLGDAPADLKSAILDAFPARRQRLQTDLDIWRTYRQYNDITEINELRVLNAGLAAQVVHLQGTVERLMGVGL
ncbi:hypothetical protein B0H11DRAFT_2285348 [Mycena galericulata]|nr:hypothetical protein B0H11DRAFT_2285348 [Mycena galericulata]